MVGKEPPKSNKTLVGLAKHRLNCKSVTINELGPIGLNNYNVESPYFLLPYSKYQLGHILKV